jgi:hypothetical protein
MSFRYGLVLAFAGALAFAAVGDVLAAGPGGGGGAGGGGGGGGGSGKPVNTNTSPLASTTPDTTLQTTVGQAIRFGVEAQDGQNEPTIELSSPLAGLEIATISASRPNPAKGTPWLVIAQTNIFTPTEAGTFEAVFTLTDPVTGMTKQVTFTIVVAAA